MFALLLTTLLIAGACAVPISQDELDREWLAFKQQFRSDNSYVTEEEEAYRRSVFDDNYRFIVQHNIEADKGLHTFTVGVNQFTDMTNQEWVQKLGFLTPLNTTGHEVEVNSFASIPTSVDWRSKGVVAGIKNQGQCGSCWAFAAVAALEGQYAKVHGRIQTLSEQNILDCNHQTSCQTGGNIDIAYNTITREGGIESEADYPYTSGQTQRYGTCHFQKSLSKCTLQRFSTISGETGIAQQVANVGPLAVFMDASDNAFKQYHSGIYSSRSCSAQRLNHAVTAVGYGSNYWIIRNSWGTTWGNQGNFQIARGSNMCGIGYQGVWPTGVN